jgi:hypothetical protein
MHVRLMCYARLLEGGGGLIDSLAIHVALGRVKYNISKASKQDL